MRLPRYQQLLPRLQKRSRCDPKGASIEGEGGYGTVRQEFLFVFSTAQLLARIIREDIASAQSLGERYLNPILSTSADCGKLGA